MSVPLEDWQFVQWHVILHAGYLKREENKTMVDLGPTPQVNCEISPMATRFEQLTAAMAAISANLESLEEQLRPVLRAVAEKTGSSKSADTTVEPSFVSILDNIIEQANVQVQTIASLIDRSVV